MRLIRAYILLLSLALLVACGSQSPDEELSAELQTVTSWTATAHTVADAWLLHNVPSAYTKQTLQTARDELQSEAETLGNASAGVDQRHAAVLKLVDGVEQTVGQMAAAVGRGDRNAVAGQIQQLATSEKRLSAFGTTLGAQR